MTGRRSDRITDLGELQLDVLDALGRIGEGTVYDVLDAFPEDERPRYTTALTVLKALEKKGLVTHRTEDRAFVFRPAIEPGEVRTQLLGDVLKRVFRGSPGALVASLLDTEAVTPDVLDELKSLIEDVDGENDDD
ncbi:MAG TPA: BlaI/MecI/CopY family transcriptional regulator [Armatimonadota bacterium]|nr:BlaI/MecI/CopY family transcriptional regulator [Armatimonadota bacterium]